ncbi:hypothetical protein [Candidatus Fokinia crypta]|uniref:Uncharacterized protein n=1 Tax=Candidatus Fokinia crypta TaxID=1920990 RepID=A0ABZ0UP09_9RICK|nr:hypothetical protein [Candidatus Fokinia cryptica]WPX97868.1 hypothetical protein Fokcrypt_00391 [Candidatus Fokinia cryptica]
MKKSISLVIVTAIFYVFSDTVVSDAAPHATPSVQQQVQKDSVPLSTELGSSNTPDDTSIQSKVNSLVQGEVTVVKDEVKILVKPLLNLQYGAVMNNDVFKSADALQEKYKFKNKTELFKAVYPYNIMNPGNPSRWGSFNGLVNFNNVIVDVSTLSQGLKYGGNLSLYANVSKPTSGGNIMTAGEAYVYCESIKHKIKIKAGSTVGVQNTLLISGDNLAKGGMGLSGDLPFYIQYPAIAPYDHKYDKEGIYVEGETPKAIFTLQPFVDSASLPGPANIAPKANKISVTKELEFPDFSAIIGASFTPDTQVKGTLSNITSISGGSLNGFKNVIGYGGKFTAQVNSDIILEASLVGEFTGQFDTVCDVEKMGIDATEGSLKIRMTSIELRRKGGNAVAIGGLIKYREKYALALGYGNYGSTGDFTSAKVSFLSDNKKKSYEGTYKDVGKISSTSGYYISAGASYTGDKNGVSLTYLYGNANGLRQQQIYQILTGVPAENFGDGNRSEFLSFAYERKILSSISGYLSCDHFALSCDPRSGVKGNSGWAIATGLKLKA